MTDSFAMIDACTSCYSEHTCFSKVISDGLLTSKNEFIDRLIDLCVSLVPDSASRRVDACVETDLISTMALPEASTQRVIQSKVPHEMLEDCSYGSLYEQRIWRLTGYRSFCLKLTLSHNLRASEKPSYAKNWMQKFKRS